MPTPRTEAYLFVHFTKFRPCGIWRQRAYIVVQGKKLSAFPVVLTTEQVHVAPVFPQGGAGGKVGAALVLRSAVVRHRLSFHAAPYRITMSVKIRYILYFRHKNIPFLQQRRQAVPPVFFGFLSNFCH